MSAEDIFWICVAIPVGLGLGLAVADALFGIDFTQPFRKRWDRDHD